MKTTVAFLLAATVVGAGIVLASAAPQSVQVTVFPRGGIVMWGGPISALPNGWVLCDGANGTPDLRDRFVVGSGNGYAVNDTGGSTTHQHGLSTASIPPHVHTLQTAVGAPVYWGNDHHLGVTTEHGGGVWGDQYEKNRYGVAADTLTTDAASSGQVSGSTDSAGSLPPYYSLAYIMKR